MAEELAFGHQVNTVEIDSTAPGEAFHHEIR